MNNFTSGAEIDIRPKEQKDKDYKFEELVANINPVNWVEKPQSEWRKFPIFNQNGSGSCVAQTEAKELGIMRFLKDGQYVHFSASDIYQRRNPKRSGMGAIDARRIAKEGVTLEVLAPSQSLTDAQMDAIIVEPYKREVGKVFSVPNYVELPVKDIESVASFIQTTGKGAMVWFYFDYPEWTTHPTVINQNLDLYAETTPRHSVTAVDFSLVNGKKCLIIEDSWGVGTGIGGQRIIDEDFFKVRNWYAGYLANFNFDNPQPIKPKHHFSKDMEFGQKNMEIEALQTCLQYLDLFPANSQITGYFGSITRKAVQDFQIKHNIAIQGEVGFGRVGPITRSILNSLFY